jgi:hypothetical protein
MAVAKTIQRIAILDTAGREMKGAKMMTHEEYEKLEREFEEMMATPLPKVKPKPKPEMHAPITPRVAEAVRANPQSLRIVAEAADGTVVIERPRPLERLEVVEVDTEGRPRRAQRYDCLTGQWSELDFVGGYRRSGIETDYNPIARFEEGLKR